VLSIGNFDGVHLGHRQILRSARTKAQQLGVPLAVMTFHPHPVRLLRPHVAPRLLTNLDQKLELLAAEGVDWTLVMPFTRTLAGMTADRFIRQVLVDALGIQSVHIGSSFRFGADRQGTVDLLAELGAELGFEAHGGTSVDWQGAPVSSTRIRDALAKGSAGHAREMLSRPYFLDGRVCEGARLGRKLGFPTLNLRILNEIVPATGVYVTASYVPSLGHVLPSVTNIGVRPTVSQDQHESVETYVLDVDRDMYGEEVRLYFLYRVRGERKFESVTELTEQIGHDVAQVRSWFAGHPLDREELVLPGVG
jgi:riboflavin kinase/FMN adenylyltransferase